MSPSENSFKNTLIVRRQNAPQNAPNGKLKFNTVLRS